MKITETGYLFCFRSEQAIFGGKVLYVGTGMRGKGNVQNSGNFYTTSQLLLLDNKL